MFERSVTEMKWYRHCFRVLLVVAILLSLACVPEARIPTEGGRGFSPSGEAEAASSFPPSNEALRERIAILEEALRLRRAGERMELHGDLIGALLSFRRSNSLFPDALLAEKMRRLEAGEGAVRPPRPDLQPLRERIAMLEDLLAGLGTLEDLFDSPAKAPGVPFAPEFPVHLEDERFEEDSEWRNFPDLPEEKAAIEESFKEFRNALKEGDIPRAVVHIDEGRREEYAALFGHMPEAMPSFAEILEKAEMSFLASAERVDPETTTRLRTSEYAVELDGFTFYIRWVKVDGRWMLFDF